MPGPNGEQCSTCYYFEELDGGPYGYCRFENAEFWLEQKGRLGERTFPKVHGLLDWSGDWLDAVSATAGFRAVGAFVTPTGTTFNITDTVNWVRFDPGNLLPGAIMDNVTLTNGELAWSIPGTPPPGTTYEVLLQAFGSVTFPNPNTFLELTPGQGGVPYSANVLQRLQVNPQTDDLSLPWSFVGLAPTTQTGVTEMLVRGNIGLGNFTSAAYQIIVQRRG